MKKKDILKDKGGTVHLDDSLPMTDKKLPMPGERIGHRFHDHIMKKNIAGKIKKNIEKEKGSYDDNNPEHREIMDKKMREAYDTWVKEERDFEKVRKTGYKYFIPKNLIESGWEHYLED